MAENYDSQNIQLKSEPMSVTRRAFSVANPDLLLRSASPSTYLVDGEWLSFQTTNRKLVRASDVTTPDAVGARMSFPMWGETGRTDTLGLSGRKVPVLYLGSFVLDTKMFSASVVAGANGAAITAIGQRVKVATITLNGRNFSGLVGMGAVGTDNDLAVGYVEELPTNNGGYLRIRGGLFG